jgi:hypothetical protein
VAGWIHLTLQLQPPFWFSKPRDKEGLSKK